MGECLKTHRSFSQYICLNQVSPLLTRKLRPPQFRVLGAPLSVEQWRVAEVTSSQLRVLGAPLSVEQWRVAEVTSSPVCVSWVRLCPLSSGARLATVRDVVFHGVQRAEPPCACGVRASAVWCSEQLRAEAYAVIEYRMVVRSIVVITFS